VAEEVFILEGIYVDPEFSKLAKEKAEEAQLKVDMVCGLVGYGNSKDNK
jgi:hypothetical protein